MRLCTLGGLELEGSPFSGPKPLLLLGYLTLEGAKPRGFVAELLWPEAKDPRNMLASALKQLRRDAPGSIDADRTHVWSKVDSDAGGFLLAVEGREFREALSLYKGPLFDGVSMPWGVELEEWVFETREAFARRARHAHLRLAELEAARGDFAAAARRAEAAHGLEVAPAYEPEELTRLYPLLQAGHSPLAVVIKAEAAGYGIELEALPRRGARALAAGARQAGSASASSSRAWRAASGPGCAAAPAWARRRC